MPNYWIKKAINPANKGKLRARLGAKKGKPIPADKLNAAAKDNGVVGKRARLAISLRRFQK